jgi:hypothetical protein
MDLSRVFLNDTAKTLFTDAILLPVVKQIYDEVAMELIANGIPIENEIALITVPAGTTVLTYSTTPPIPADLFNPIELSERTSGSSDAWSYMDEKRWDSNAVTQLETLRVWCWREQALNFVGATTIRQIRVKYQKVLAAIGTAPNDTIDINGAKNYMAARVAAVAAEYMGGNETRAAALNKLASDYAHQVMNIAVRNRQGLPARRKPFGFGRKYSSRVIR